MTHLKEMKNALKLFALVFICCVGIILANVSCKHVNEYPTQTATMDSLSKELSGIDVLLKQQDSTKIKKCIDRVIIAQDNIQMLEKDTMSNGAKDIFKAYSNTRWQLQMFLGRRTMLYKEVEKSVKQLDHLSHDLANGLLQKDSAMTYFGYEVKKATELAEASKYGLEMVKMEVPLNEMVQPQADSLVARLKNHEKI
jgi:hypothetical protein